MGDFTGMDPAVIRTLAARLRSQASALEQTLGHLDVIVGQVQHEWLGPAADSFVHQWHSRLRADMVASARAVAGLATSASNNAGAQEQVSAGHGDVGSWSSGSRSNGHVTKAGVLIDLADGAYPAYAGSLHGFDVVSPQELREMGFAGSIVDHKSGFGAVVLRDAEGRYVVSFRGTEGGLLGVDADADAFGAAYMSAQSEQAVALTGFLVGSVGKDHVTLTGHSLGGRLAAVSSVATGAPAVTFNAAGVSDSEFMYAREVSGHHYTLMDYSRSMVGGFDGDRAMLANGQITNYSSVLDPLTVAQEESPLPDALGKQVIVTDPQKATWGGAHSLDAIRRGLDL